MELLSCEPLVQETIQRYQHDRGNLISILQDIQAELGYLPREALVVLTNELPVPESHVWGIVTFYSQFHLIPRGRNTIRVCTGTACHVNGANKLLGKLEDLLAIGPGETTADGCFSLETVRCLGTCFLAPVIMVNDRYFGNLVSGEVEAIIDHYRDA